jgi:hypothetical protein
VICGYSRISINAGEQLTIVENGRVSRNIEAARDLGKEVEARDGVRRGDVLMLDPPISSRAAGFVLNLKARARHDDVESMSVNPGPS